MALPPDIEARVAACEEKQKLALESSDSLTRRLEQLLSEFSSDGIVLDEIEFENSSVVRHVEDLKRTAERAKRESAQRTPSGRIRSGNR